MYSDNDCNTSVQEEREVLIEGKNNVDEAEISQYRFGIPLIHNDVKVLWIIFGCFVAAVNIISFMGMKFEMLIDQGWSPIMGKREYSASDFPVYVCTVLLLILHIGVDIYFKFVASYPEVRGTLLYFEGTEYHYSEISCINTTSIHHTTVHLPDGKTIILSGDYDNYGKFIKWAEKCRIPIACSK